MQKFNKKNMILQRIRIYIREIYSMIKKKLEIEDLRLGKVKEFGKNCIRLLIHLTSLYKCLT
jgi:hypothetical protein